MRNRALPVTTMPVSPEDDRHRRIVRYTMMMGIRVVCLIIAVIVPWPWTLVPALGAIFLPYFAVMVANAAGSSGGRQVERPALQLNAAPHPRDEEPWEAELRRRDAAQDAS